MAAASRVLRLAAFRPAMVTEYGKKGADAEAARWRAYKIFTNVVTIATGVALVLLQDYPGTTSKGEHALTNTQAWARRMFTGLVTGDFSPAAALHAPDAAAPAVATSGVEQDVAAATPATSHTEAVR